MPTRTTAKHHRDARRVLRWILAVTAALGVMLQPRPASADLIDFGVGIELQPPGIDLDALEIGDVFTFLITFTASPSSTIKSITTPSGASTGGFLMFLGATPAAVGTTISGSPTLVMSLAFQALSAGSASLTTNSFNVTLAAPGFDDTSVNGITVRSDYTVLGPTTTPVPEPASMTLLGLGLAGFGARRWRQRRNT